ncbi:site-specific DNA-methyltransferase [Neobacillus notoginsengisoli]|uniref:Site-specific DNA-methyltransferase n=1 Tax=Neobacillus notoginsengisoli TaxID=1578198 RepID=A0A417YPC2_9BACI|nr:site-specific DNA-methyltransferase [Neobacillus notoginsengisoli]RHW35681.1 site-specific DNA-methyltransferase [Neobacillus notoginsengisoli]
MRTVDHSSFDLAKQNRKELMRLFPEAFIEGKIDFEKLKLLLGEIVETERERYEFSWNGKKKAMKMTHSRSTGTLRPDKPSSKNWFETENLYIEGDNLEVLKILQKAYFGKLKMIYIDPPYNTGRDFVYKDNFHGGIKNYKELTGQTTRANAETSGRFHTDWLNMMYPRLKLARNLLADNGVIFLSIDDNEVTNLRAICNEIFGELNFVAQLPTIMNLKGNNDQFGFSGTHEYTLVFAKNIANEDSINQLPLTEEDIGDYSLKDEKGYYKQGATLMRTGEAGAREKRPKGYYPIYVTKELTRISIERMNPDDFEVYPKTADGKEMTWRRSKETLAKTYDEFIVKKSANGISFYKKQRLEEEEGIRGKKPKTLFYKPEYSSGNGTNLLKRLFNGKVFDNPKPLELIKDFVLIGSGEDDIVLDFFSGSSTTAHAVMDVNRESGSRRKFIMVQIPERAAPDSEAAKAGFSTICEIAKERIRRAGSVIEAVGSKDIIDTGFRVYKLDSSNLKAWRPDYNDLERNLFDLEDMIKAGRTKEDLLTELLLKVGVPLTERLKELDFAGKKIYKARKGALLICLEEEVTLDLVSMIVRHKAGDVDTMVIFRESGFLNDTVKTNAIQTLKKSGITYIRSI